MTTPQHNSLEKHEEEMERKKKRKRREGKKEGTPPQHNSLEKNFAMASIRAMEGAVVCRSEDGGR